MFCYLNSRYRRTCRFFFSSCAVPLVLVMGCCGETEVMDTATPVDAAAAAKPEIRYYMIADT